MNSKKQLLIALSICLIFFLRGKQFILAFQRNIANTVIHNSLSQTGIAAISRQRSLAIATTLLGADLRAFSNAQEANGDMPMIPASFRGLYYHRSDDWTNAAKWYGVAAIGKPIPEKQKQILISPWMKLAPSGDFMLEAIVDEWHIRADTAPGAKITKTDRGTLEFSCSETMVGPKWAALEWNQVFDIPYHHALVIKAKTEIGTMLILATVIDGQWVRHFVETGTGKWEDYIVSLEGDHVKYIYVQIREDAKASEQSCLAEIDSLTFLLDE